MVQIAQIFERFLETYRRPDGSKWGGKQLQDATGVVVTRSYVSTLRKGRIENPGFEKLRAIAKAMNFPLNVRRVERGEYNRPGPHLRKPRADRYFEGASDRDSVPGDGARRASGRKPTSESVVRPPRDADNRGTPPGKTPRGVRQEPPRTAVADRALCGLRCGERRLFRRPFASPLRLALGELHRRGAG